MATNANRGALRALGLTMTAALLAAGLLGAAAVPASAAGFDAPGPGTASPDPAPGQPLPSLSGAYGILGDLCDLWRKGLITIYDPSLCQAA